MTRQTVVSLVLGLMWGSMACSGNAPSGAGTGGGGNSGGTHASGGTAAGGKAAGGSTSSAGGSTTLPSGGQTSGSGGASQGQGGDQAGRGGTAIGGRSDAGGSTASSSGGQTSGSGGAGQGQGGGQGGGGVVASGGISASGGRSASAGAGGTAGGGTTGGTTGGAAGGGAGGASSSATGGAGGSTGTGGQPAACGPSGTPDIWNLPKFSMATGPYTADWKALGLAYSTPQWWRDAKFGAWAHWDPQSMPEQGDWYAYHMYQENSADFNYNVSHYGDPSVYGYKDICHDWKIDLWDPNALMDLYVQMGAKFFMAMGSHHDNFDNWDSSYQPWNSVKVGVKKDMVGTWAPIARQKGMRFGIGFHNTPARTYGQWMPIRYTSDAKGPYDAMLTTADGNGKWWQGMNPADLYGPKHSGDCSNNSCNNSAYGTQFMYRVDEAICKYQPDVVYFDDHAGDSQTDLGVHMGLGSIAPTILANYYNKSLTWSKGKTADVVMNMKGVGGQYNSFQNSATLEPYAERALVRSTEAATESAISAYPFQTELDIQGGNWHYMTGAGYTSASSLVTTLMQNVSRNGSLLLNLTQHGRGNLDTQCTQIAQDIGAWLKVNGEAIYGTKPWQSTRQWSAGEVPKIDYSQEFNATSYDVTRLTEPAAPGKAAIEAFFTAKANVVYAILPRWPGRHFTVKELAGARLKSVALLGSTAPLHFKTQAGAVTIDLPEVPEQLLGQPAWVLKLSR